MFEIAYAPNSEKGRIERVYGDFIPRLRDVRRVPVRYQQILPLPVVKRHQCVVLGMSSRTLTLGIVERRDEKLFAFLHKLTGATIFPVLIEPERMRLLIARMERYQRFRRRSSQAYYVLQMPYQVRLLLMCKERREREE